MKNAKPLSNNEIAAFCDQMAMIVKAGIPTDEGILIMLEDTQAKGGQAILKEISGALNTGLSFSDSLKAAGVFPTYVLEMIRLGEMTGKLDNVLDSLAVYYSREEAIAKGVKSAITYPLIMIGMMLLIIIVLMVQVMPVFNQVFIQLGAEMTGFSQGILAAGNVIRQYALVFVAILAVILGLAMYFSKSPAGRKKFGHFAARFVMTRKLNEKIALSRFANGLSMTISSGLDTDQCLDLVESITEHPTIKTKIGLCRKALEQGESFAAALHQAGLFSGIYDSILAVGGKSGNMDEAMGRIAVQYSNEVDDSIEHTLAILEPTLVAIIAVIVGMILLSVMFPLLGIMSNIG